MPQLTLVWKLYLFDVIEMFVFEFDPAKSAANAVKHGINFELAQALWDGRKRHELPTWRPKADEERWVVIGEIDDRLWTAVITYRGDTIRLISVRRARDDETAWYHGGGV